MNLATPQHDPVADTLAEFFQRLAGLCADTARQLHRADASDAYRGDASAGISAPALRMPERDPGHRQEQILALPGLQTGSGLTTRSIAEATENDAANTDLTLKNLEALGFLERVPNSNPRQWRYAGAHRTWSEVYKEVAELVQPGEWTTAGDVSVAVIGDVSASGWVGNMAWHKGLIANHHRLMVGNGAEASDGQRARLEQEGVRFGPDGLADPSQRVRPESLRQRLLRRRGKLDGNGQAP